MLSSAIHFIVHCCITLFLSNTKWCACITCDNGRILHFLPKFTFCSLTLPPYPNTIMLQTSLTYPTMMYSSIHIISIYNGLTNFLDIATNTQFFVKWPSRLRFQGQGQISRSSENFFHSWKWSNIVLPTYVT